MEKWGKTKYNALTLVFCSCSLWPACAVWWRVYDNYLIWRLHKYVSSDVDMNIDTKFGEVIFKEEMFMCINQVCNCLTKYVRMNILNVRFNNLRSIIINNDNKSVSLRRNSLSIKTGNRLEFDWNHPRVSALYCKVSKEYVEIFKSCSVIMANCSAVYCHNNEKKNKDKTFFYHTKRCCTSKNLDCQIKPWER